MIDDGRWRLLEAVAQAAAAYRGAMRRYIGEQARLLDAGVPIEAVADLIADGFAELSEAEDALDDALTVLAWYDTSARAGGQ